MSIKRIIKRFFLGTLFLFLAYSIYLEIYVIGICERVKMGNQKAFVNRHASWMPAIYYYLRPYCGAPNQRYMVAAHNIIDSGDTTLETAGKKVGVVAWRYFSEYEIDSINEQP
jgi:hypothetical protein